MKVNSESPAIDKRRPVRSASAKKKPIVDISISDVESDSTEEFNDVNVNQKVTKVSSTKKAPSLKLNSTTNAARRTMSKPDGDTNPSRVSATSKKKVIDLSDSECNSDSSDDFVHTDGKKRNAKTQNAKKRPASKRPVDSTKKAPRSIGKAKTTELDSSVAVTPIKTDKSSDDDSIEKSERSFDDNVMNGNDEDVMMQDPADAVRLTPVGNKQKEKKLKREIMSSLPLIFPPKLNRHTLMLQCEDESLDFSGDAGVIGRFKADKESGIFVDLKGVIYKGEVFPCTSWCVVNIGETSARVEAVMNDFVQLKSVGSGFATMTMTGGTLADYEDAADESFLEFREDDSNPKPIKPKVNAAVATTVTSGKRKAKPSTKAGKSAAKQKTKLLSKPLTKLKEKSL